MVLPYGLHFFLYSGNLNILLHVIAITDLINLFSISNIKVEGKPAKVKRQKKWLKRREKSNTYLTHVLAQMVANLNNFFFVVCSSLYQ